jgi:hypothetical protein
LVAGAGLISALPPTGWPIGWGWVLHDTAVISKLDKGSDEPNMSDVSNLSFMINRNIFALRYIFLLTDHTSQIEKI